MRLRKIIQNSFYQLLVIYTILIFLVSLNFFWKYILHFEILALILGILGMSIIQKQEQKQEQEHTYKYFNYILFFLTFFYVILSRIIPYLNNQIPLGYDTGIYKYAIEHGLSNLDNWVLRGVEPGFLYLMEFFKLFFSIQFILTYLLIGFCVLLGIAVYFVSSEYFDKKTGLIALMLYSISLIQFKTFWYMYYKNIIGLSLMLFAVYFLKKYEDNKNKKFISLFILTGGILGGIHRPTFYIFGLSYFFYAFISPFYLNNITNNSNAREARTSEAYKGAQTNKSLQTSESLPKFSRLRYNFRLSVVNMITGILILLIAVSFYIGKFSPAVLSMFEPLLEGFYQPGESPGTFINFFTYQFSTLTYLPFAILGFFILIKKRNFNMIFFLTLITGIIVYFQFFFFNRSIVHLDILLIILSSLGFAILIKNKKYFGYFILSFLLFSGLFLSLNESMNSQPLISIEELTAIESLSSTEKNAFVMATSSIYSPWLLGYSERKTIAPGLFDYNKHTEQEWAIFWKTSDINKLKEFLDAYEKPLYIFIGEKQEDNLQIFEQCFSEIYSKNSRIYRYVC